MKSKQQPDLFGPELVKAQPRAGRLTPTIEAAIDNLRRYGFSVMPAGSQHRCVANGISLTLDDRQLVAFSRKLDKQPPPVLPITRRIKRIQKGSRA